MCNVHKNGTGRANGPGPFSARLWSVQYPFQARFRAVLLKRSGVKRYLREGFFAAYCSSFSISTACGVTRAA